MPERPSKLSAQNKIPEGQGLRRASRLVEVRRRTKSRRPMTPPRAQCWLGRQDSQLGHAPSESFVIVREISATPRGVSLRRHTWQYQWT
jgi:hypothetical protein